MKNSKQWQPSKFVTVKGKLKASRNIQEVGRGSRFIGDLMAKAYSNVITNFAHGKLLDLGCGKAPLYNVYKDLCSEITCADWENSVHSLNYCDQLFDLTGSYPFNNNSFDTVLSTDVVEHLKNPDNFFTEINRVLAPGGRLILSCPFYYSIHEAPYDFYRYTEYALRAFCEDQGLTVLHLEPYGGAIEVLLDVTAKLTGTRPILSTLHLAAATLLMKFRFLADRRAKHFPLGYVLVAAKD